MKKLFAFLAVASLSTASWAGQTRQDVTKRLQRAGEVINEIMKVPEKGIPSEVLGGAKCIAVVPNMIKGGLGIGGEHGRGVVSCRTENGWSAPTFFTISGVSLGFQIGGAGVDLVLTIMNDHGMRSLLSSKFQVGGDASAAAGPVGRHAEADTDIKAGAEILTYSRAKGAFAGVALKGAYVRQDDDSTKALYGKDINYENILAGKVRTPAPAQSFLAAIRQAKAEVTARKH